MRFLLLVFIWSLHSCYAGMKYCESALEEIHQGLKSLDALQLPISEHWEREALIISGAFESGNFWDQDPGPFQPLFGRFVHTAESYFQEMSFDVSRGFLKQGGAIWPVLHFEKIPDGMLRDYQLRAKDYGVDLVFNPGAGFMTGALAAFYPASQKIALPYDLKANPSYLNQVALSHESIHAKLNWKLRNGVQSVYQSQIILSPGFQLPSQKGKPLPERANFATREKEKDGKLIRDKVFLIEELATTDHDLFFLSLAKGEELKEIDNSEFWHLLRLNESQNRLTNEINLAAFATLEYAISSRLDLLPPTDLAEIKIVADDLAIVIQTRIFGEDHLGIYVDVYFENSLGSLMRYILVDIDVLQLENELKTRPEKVIKQLLRKAQKQSYAVEKNTRNREKLISKMKQVVLDEHHYETRQSFFRALRKVASDFPGAEIQDFFGI